MTLDEIYQTVQSSPGGSSGRGMSYWGNAAQCGRLAILDQQYRERRDPDEESALAVGVYYHALHEVGLRGQAAGEVWDQTDSQVQNPNWKEAVRLYRAYRSHWGTPCDKWKATLLGTEVKIPSTPAGETAAARFFGDVTTGRMDALIHIADVDATYEATGLLLPAPGRYILDHKTAKSRGDKHQWEFQFGLQSITYLHIYNMEHPDEPVHGMIFDQIYKHKDISKDAKLNKAGEISRESSYEAFLATPLHDEEKVIQALVALGKDNVEKNRTNPKHCFAGFKPCRFFVDGTCKRY